MNETAASRLSATLIARQQLAPTVVLLRFRMREGDALRWLPGQHLTLATYDAPDEATPYSIASAPAEAFPGEFELAVSANGGQELLARLHRGAMVYVTAPQGHFVWTPARGAALLVGMGTGLSPLRAMVQAALCESNREPVVLLSGARSEVDILWREEFTELATRESRFSFEPTLSRPGPAWRGRAGRVQEHLAGIIGNLPGVSAFVCGSRAMVAECVSRLTGALGVDPQRVFSEAH